MNPHRQAKNAQLTQLASQVESGVIVELGAYRGEGTVALCQGARVPVYAVDDYQPRRGWAGEQYWANDSRIFAMAMRQSGYTAHLVIGDVGEVARSWEQPIGLLVWDLGAEGRLAKDFADWQGLVMGRWAIHDTDDDRFSRDLNPPGWRKWKESVFWLLQREP